MTNLNENSLKTHIEIEGAILTPEALKKIRNWQNNDNEELRCSLEVIAEAVCFIGSIFYLFDHDKEKQEAAQVIADLSSVRDELKQIQKP